MSRGSHFQCPEAILRQTLSEGGSVELPLPHPGKQGKDLSCAVRTGKSFSKFFGKFPEEKFHHLGTPEESEEILDYIEDREPSSRKTGGDPVDKALHKNGISLSKVGKHLGFRLENKVKNPTPDQMGRSLRRGRPAALIVERSGTPKEGTDREKGLHVMGLKGYQKKGKQSLITVNDSLRSRSEKVPYQKGKPLSLASGKYRPTELWDTQEKD